MLSFLNRRFLINLSSPAVCQTLLTRLSSGKLFECGVTNIQDSADFEKRVLLNSAPVLVDFHATWCGPCKLLGPRLENAVAAYAKTVLLAKVDVDNLDDVATKYGVSAVPTVVAMKDGQEVERFTGLKEEDYIKRMIEKLCR